MERVQQTLTDRLRKIRLDEGGSWTDHLKRAVESINEAAHSITGFSPKELWEGTSEMRKEAHEKMVKWREKRNQGRRLFPAEFVPEQKVWAFDAVAASSREHKFAPRWKGPYILKEKLTESLWRVTEDRGNRPGRRPVLIFHQDHLQPCLE